jgi:hypothetical protein
VAYTAAAAIGGDFILAATVEEIDGTTGKALRTVCSPNPDAPEVRLRPARERAAPARFLVQRVVAALGANMRLLLNAVRAGRRVRVRFRHSKTGVITIVLTVGCAALASYRLSLTDVRVITLMPALVRSPPGVTERPAHVLVWEKGSYDVHEFRVLRDGVDVTNLRVMNVVPMDGRAVCVYADFDITSKRPHLFRVSRGWGLSRVVSAGYATDIASMRRFVADVAHRQTNVVRELTTATAETLDQTRVGSPRKFHFPFTKRSHVGQRIDVTRSDDLADDARVLVDFGDDAPDSKAIVKPSEIVHTYRRAGVFRVTAQDISGVSGQVFHTWVTVNAVGRVLRITALRAAFNTSAASCCC